MKRKLIKQAGKAYSLTLPITWIRENNLDSGDEVEVFSNERNLVISTDSRIYGGCLDLDISNFYKRMNFIYLNSAYALGIDEINFKGKCPNLNQTLGYVVLSKNGDFTTVKDVSGVSSANIDEVFKRSFHMIINFFQNAIDNVFSNEKASIDEVEALDHENNKMALFLQRNIMKLNVEEASYGRMLFAYSMELEKIGDEILRFWRECLNRKYNSSKIREIIDLCKLSLEKAFMIYFSFSDKLVSEVYKLKDEIRDKFSQINFSSDETVILMRAIKIMEDACDLTHLSLMKEFSKK